MSDTAASRHALDPVIVGARRTALGRRRGRLSGLHPHDLLAAVHDAVIADTGISPADADMVITGCVTQIGDQSYNVARMATLAGGLPVTLPAMTIDSQCGSSQQAVNVAAGLIRSGAAEVVLASGVEAMTRIPLGSAQDGGFGTPYSAGYVEGYEVIAQGESAERIADAWAISREQCDEWAVRSQRLAARATEAGRFAAEIVPLRIESETITRDEGIRDSSAESLAALRPVFRPDGRHTAGNSSQISDGAAAVLVMSRARAEREQLPVIARIAGQAFVGVDPVIKLTGAIPATEQILTRGGLGVHDVDLYEVSEAFAAVVLAWLAEIGADPQRVNVNGGAIALGHPVGASGARMITTAARELARGTGELALVAMCCGGGLGTATLLAAERD